MRSDDVFMMCATYKSLSYRINCDVFTIAQLAKGFLVYVVVGYVYTLQIRIYI